MFDQGRHKRRAIVVAGARGSQNSLGIVEGVRHWQEHSNTVGMAARGGASESVRLVGEWVGGRDEKSDAFGKAVRCGALQGEGPPFRVAEWDKNVHTLGEASVGGMDNREAKV